MRLIVNFASLSDVDLIAKTGVILTALTGNPDFPDPGGTPLSYAQLAEARNTFVAAYEAAQTRDSTKVAAKNAAKASVADLFVQLAHHVEFLAGKDPAKLKSSGFDIRQPANRHANDGIPPAPQNVLVKHGARKGSVEINTDTVPGARVYEIQINPGDPTQESTWQTAETTAQHRHLILDTLTPGQTYWFRVRAIGKEEKGLWSSTVGVMVV